MKRLLWLVLMFLLFMAACSDTQPGPDPSPMPGLSPGPVPSPTPEPSPLPSPPPSPSLSPSPDPADYHPLTGLPLTDKSLLTKRPAAVIFNNLGPALPMWGISQADIIYESLTEGGITRMLGIFSDIGAMGNLGSIRSARTCFLELALAHDAVLIHAGATMLAYDQIAAWGMNTIDGTRGQSDYFWRDADRLARKISAEHTLFTSGTTVGKAMDALVKRLDRADGFDQNLLFTDDGTPEGGEPSVKMGVPFTQAKTTFFLYAESKRLYYVEEYGKEFMDGGADRQVAVTNVLILQTAVVPIEQQSAVTPIPGDTVGQTVVTLSGSGTGYFACGGRYIPILWSRPAYDCVFSFATEEGQPLYLGRGKTYVCIVPATAKPSFLN